MGLQSSVTRFVTASQCFAVFAGFFDVSRLVLGYVRSCIVMVIIGEFDACYTNLKDYRIHVAAARTFELRFVVTLMMLG